MTFAKNQDNTQALSINEQTKGMVKTFHNQPVTASRKVAEVFEKNHAHVLRDIQNLIDQVMKSDDFSQSKSGLADSEKFLLENFFRVSYKDRQGKQRTEYKLTKDAFAMIVMGYTGAKAIAFKVAYIQRFNEMEQQLSQREANAHQQAIAFVELAGIKADCLSFLSVVPSIVDDYGRKCYHYLLSLEKLGFSTRSGQVWKRERRHPLQFIRRDNATYVTEAFINNMFVGKVKAHNDKAFQSLQAVLPFNTQGGNHESL